MVVKSVSLAPLVAALLLSMPALAFGSQMAVDASGNLHLAYYASLGDRGLKYLTNASGSWVTEPVPSDWATPFAIAVDSLGKGGHRKAVMESPLHAEVRRDRTPGFSVMYKEDRVPSVVHTFPRNRNSHTSTDSGRTSLCNESLLKMCRAVHTINDNVNIPFVLLIEEFLL